MFSVLSLISENTEYICNYEKDTNNRSPLYIDYKKIHSSPMILKQHRHRRDNNEKDCKLHHLTLNENAYCEDCKYNTLFVINFIQ